LRFLGCWWCICRSFGCWWGWGWWWWPIGWLDVIVRQQTFLSVDLLLHWNVNKFWIACCDRILSAFIPLNVFTISSWFGHTTGGILYLTSKCVGHLCEVAWFRLMVPELLLVNTCHLWDNKVDFFGDKLALLPGDWFTSFLASPNLVSLLISLPKGEALSWFPDCRSVPQIVLVLVLSLLPSALPYPSCTLCMQQPHTWSQ